MRRFLPYLALVSVLASLAGRAVIRGGDTSGWDILGPAQGQFLVSTRPLAQAVTEAWKGVRTYYYWTTVNSILYTIGPGLLSRIRPWEHWGQALTLGLFLAALLAVRRAVSLPGRDSFLLLLVWGASPALLSFGLAGPFLSATLPHALALLIICEPRIRRRPVLTLLLALAVGELSWHLYLTGRTVFLVFLAAAILEKDAPRRTRLAWAVAVLVQLFFVMRFSGISEREMLAFDDLQGRDPFLLVADLAKGLAWDLDLPVVWPLGIAAVFFLERQRRLIGIVLAAQLAMVSILAAHGADKLQTRRFLLVDFYALVAIAAAFGAAAPKVRNAILGVLLVGNVLAQVGLIQFSRAPRGERPNSLPYVQGLGDYRIPYGQVDAADQMVERIARGERVILLYSLWNYWENHTDPAALPERLYLRLGHNRFVWSVFWFSSKPCRFDCIAVEPVTKAAAFFDELRTGGRGALDRYSVYYATEEAVPAGAVDTAVVFAELRQRFALRIELPTLLRMGSFRIAPRSLDAKEFVGFRVFPKSAQISAKDRTREAPELLRFPVDSSFLEFPPIETPAVHRTPLGAEPFEARFFGDLLVCRGGSYDFLAGVQGSMRIVIDGKQAMGGASQPFRLGQKRVALERGWHSLEIGFTSLRGKGRMVFDMYRVGSGAWEPPATIEECPPEPSRLESRQR